MRFAKSLMLGTLAVVLAGFILALVAPKTAHALAATLVQVTNTISNPVPNQDVDQPARAPFQTTVNVNPVTNFNYTAVTIPAGHRLVVDYVSLSGAASSTGGPIQPIVILNSTIGGGPANLYYFAPPPTSNLPEQFYSAQQTTIYADTLLVGPAFAGFTPNFDNFNVVISGHLISNP